MAKTKSTPKIVMIPESGSNRWRWRMVAPNGRIMAESAEGYRSHGHAHRAVLAFVAYVSREDLEINDAPAD